MSGRNQPKAQKVPFRFLLREGKPFAFAGLWESWKSPWRNHPVLRDHHLLGEQAGWKDSRSYAGHSR